MCAELKLFIAAWLESFCFANTDRRLVLVRPHLALYHIITDLICNNEHLSVQCRHEELRKHTANSHHHNCCLFRPAVRPDQ